MALDINLDGLDDELVRRGIRPEVIAALSGSQPSTANTELIKKAGGMSGTPPVSFVAPGSRDYNLAVGATNTPRVSFVGSRQEPTAPEMPQRQFSGLSFVNAGEPAKPASFGPPASNPADPSSQGTPRVSFLGPAPVGAGPQDVEAAKNNAGSGTQGASTPNTAALMRAANTAPTYAPGPGEKRFNDLEAQGPPQLHGWKKYLDIAGQILSPGIESVIPGTPGNYNARLMRAARGATEEQRLRKGDQELDTASAQAQFNTPEKRRTYMQKNSDLFDDVSDFQKHDWVLSGKFPQKEPAPKTERPENLDREAYDYYVGQGMTPADARKRVLQDAQSVKPERQTHTSPFEAFAYGSPEEKQAAQDFLDMEKRLGSRYKNPSEFEEKYRLFKEDPETYRAMFGDKNKSGPDRATATRMLNYFDKRRREVNSDFTLDDQQKQQQLQDIETLEKPFLDAVQPDAGGAGQDRVEVVHPNGQRGTVPRSQLDKAKKKGYREAPAQ